MKKTFISGCILGAAIATMALHLKDNPKAFLSVKEAAKKALAGLLPKKDDSVEPVYLTPDLDETAVTNDT